MCDGTPRCENPRPTWPGRGFSSFPTEDGMGNYSSGARRPATGSSPVRRTAPARTPEGGDGRARDAKSELYLTAVSTMVGEGNAYESGDARLERMRELVAAVVDADPQWLAGFIPWLRSEAQVRTGSVVLAAETARAMHVHRRNRVTAASPISVRRIVDSARPRVAGGGGAGRGAGLLAHDLRPDAAGRTAARCRRCRGPAVHRALGDEVGRHG